MILNLTQYPGTPEQGVTDLAGSQLDELKLLLKFVELPTPPEITRRARVIADIAHMNGIDGGDNPQAMIGGAPYLMAPLERALRNLGIEPVYAFSRRQSVEQVQPDGSIRKTNGPLLVGFVAAA